jgi:hypothetical protein
VGQNNLFGTFCDVHGHGVGYFLEVSAKLITPIDIATAWALVTATAVHHNMYFVAEMTVLIDANQAGMFERNTVV